MKHHWLREAVAYGGTPIIFYGTLYGTLGLLFLAGSQFLDPNMAPVGAILLATGLVFPTIFVIVAYLQRGLSPRGLG